MKANTSIVMNSIITTVKTIAIAVMAISGLDSNMSGASSWSDTLKI